MNNEILLYNLIKNNGGELIMKDAEVAAKIGKSVYSIPFYKKKLIKSGYIQTKVQVINNTPTTCYRIIKEYNGEVDIKW